MSATVVRWCTLLCTLAAGTAQAQAPLTMDFDDVMVVPIQPSDPNLQSEAAALDRLLAEAIGQGNVLTDISEVPAFDEQGYDAKTYMESCPPGRYAGCMLVVAQRVEMDWAIGGTLQPADLGNGENQLTIHVIDVPGSREVMAFGVVVTGENTDAGVIAGVSGVFDNLLAGLADEVDVRGDLDDPLAQQAFEERRQKLIAASLAALEAQLGDVIREEIAMGRLDPPKLTRRDLAEYANRDDVAPWDRLGMTQAQFIRYENSEASLLEWRRRIRGRLGQVLIRVDFGGGPGPWGLHHEGRWLVSFDTASGQFFDSAVRQYQEARRAGSSEFQFELGFGVAPWVEVAGVFGLRIAPFSFRFDQDVAEDPVAVPGTLIQTPGRTTEFGVRAQFIPMPTYPVRPTLHTGFYSWKGGAIVPDQPPLTALDAPSATYVQVGPGVEASAGRYLNFFLRGHVNAILSGEDSWLASRSEGAIEQLEAFEEPLGVTGVSWGIQAGFQIRISLLPDPDDRARLGPLQDEEPDF